MQSDPIGLAGGSASTYSYVNGQPTRHPDPMGLWSTEAHNYFLGKAFPGLSATALADVMAGSKYADSALFHQGADSSYMHAMSSSAWPKAKARERMCKYVKDKLWNCRRMMSVGMKKKAYFQLGMGLHAVMDSTSPAHRGFQEWKWSNLFDHGPWASSNEHMGDAYVLEYETVRAMKKALAGDLSECGCQ